MTGKNPYERQDELDIPDFVEDKTNSDSSIDMSIFKMSDDELYDDTDEERLEYDDGFDKLQPKKKKRSGGGALAVCLFIIFLLLISSLGAAWYAYKQHQEYVKANTENLQLKANVENYEKQISERDAQIADLKQQLEEKNSKPAAGDGDLIYEVVDGPMYFRKEPTSDADRVKYEGAETAENGDRFMVIEVVNDKDLGDEYQWAKIAEDVYFCLGTKDDVWAKKVD